MTSLRKLFIALGLVLTLAILTWGVGILYWHLRIRSALKKIEEISARSVSDGDLANPDYVRARDVLFDAGCRSLPHLVGALDEARHFRFLRQATYLIFWHASYPGTTAGQSLTLEEAQRQSAWLIDGDAVEMRRLKINRIRTWWTEQGAEHHQVWRFWTSACRPVLRN